MFFSEPESSFQNRSWSTVTCCGRVSLFQKRSRPSSLGATQSRTELHLDAPSPTIPPGAVTVEEVAARAGLSTGTSPRARGTRPRRLRAGSSPLATGTLPPPRRPRRRTPGTCQSGLPGASPRGSALLSQPAPSSRPRSSFIDSHLSPPRPRGRNVSVHFQSWRQWGQVPSSDPSSLRTGRRALSSRAV